LAPRLRNRRAGQPGRRETNADAQRPEERILQAAIELFADRGYSGTSTRGIAHRAKINEASLYRYFTSKRAMFTAALERELQAVRAQLDCLGRRTSQERPREGIRQLFHLIANIVTQHPELMRLLQFSALEFGAAMNPVYRKHLDKAICATEKHLLHWPAQEALPGSLGETAVLAFLAAVVTAQNFHLLFTKAPVAAATKKLMTETCADVWYTVLAQSGLVREAPAIDGLRGTRS
jgi:AcrR family transcriptional regulator